MAPFEVISVHRDGVPGVVATHDSLEDALRDRDERHEAKGGRIAPIYLVDDADDQEKGYAEWADCGLHGGFGNEVWDCPTCPAEPEEASVDG
jgi:hypothetical protein